MILGLLMAAQAAALPLPDQLSIPDGHSTVICPSDGAAKTMLNDYYRVNPAPNNHVIDTDRFFQGIEATGCRQDSPLRNGEVVIQSVVVRRTLTMAGGDERYIIYRGTNKSGGAPFVGIVSEDGNNSYPRTDLANWMVGRSADGWLDARQNDGGQIFYRCDTPEIASAVVGSMGAATEMPYKAYETKLKKQLSVQKCRVAGDRYFVNEIRAETSNDCGMECAVLLTALEVTDRSGLKVGLVYDASLM